MKARIEHKVYSLSDNLKKEGKLIQALKRINILHTRINVLEYEIKELLQ